MVQIRFNFYSFLKINRDGVVRGVVCFGCYYEDVILL